MLFSPTNRLCVRATSTVCASLCTTTLTRHASPGSSAAVGRPGDRLKLLRHSHAFALQAKVSWPKASRTASTTITSAALVEDIKAKNDQNPLVVYSKSWCPYCGQVKSLFDKHQVNYKAIDLDNLVEGDEIQQALFKITGSRTVPQVFIKGQYLGGCDATLAAWSSGRLKKLLNDAGISSRL